MSVYDLLYKAKTPTTRKNYVGVEIEFLIPRSNCDKLKAMLIKENLQWNVHLGTDGSVRDNNFQPIFEMIRVPWQTGLVPRQTNEHLRPHGSEIRILATEKEMPEYINKVCKIIKDCKGYVNNTCGLHVHLDMRNRKVDHVYNNLYALQGIMFKMQPKGRRKNEFCQYLSKKNMQHINKVIKKSSLLRDSDEDYDEDDDDGIDSDDRYYSVNKIAYVDHKTLEIRLHEGTINATDIRKWVYFLIKSADLKRKLSKVMNNIDGLDLSDKIKEYVNARIEKFTG